MVGVHRLGVGEILTDKEPFVVQLAVVNTSLVNDRARAIRERHDRVGHAVVVVVRVLPMQLTVGVYFVAEASDGRAPSTVAVHGHTVTVVGGGNEECVGMVGVFDRPFHGLLEGDAVRETVEGGRTGGGGENFVSFSRASECTSVRHERRRKGG